jgi:hypothetical protein
MNGWSNFTTEAQGPSFLQAATQKIGLNREELIDGSIGHGLNKSSNFERITRSLE